MVVPIDCLRLFRDTNVKNVFWIKLFRIRKIWKESVLFLTSRPVFKVLVPTPP